MPVPVLWHFPISHYNEKVRWALDYKRIPHHRRVLAASYMPRAWWATGKLTLPVLVLHDGAVGDSTDIIAALEERWPERPLYPSDPELRRRALELEDFFDEEVGHPVRTVLVGPLMSEAGAERTAETMMAGMGAGAKRALRLAHPLFSRFYFWRHGIHDTSREEAPDRVRRGLDRVAAELGPSGFLAGDRFSVADLTAAALLAPLARPEGTIWSKLGGLPDHVEALLASLHRHEGLQWVTRIYRDHRPPSAELYPANAPT